ncbi:hypothetical protein [Haloarcula amylolytica]|uniref:hypothetical protein n=1 Tax=Haloarcula amylolytica TaxID=396317 RepID=UPI003C75517F
MVISSEPVWGDAVDQFVQEYDHAIVYADIDQETVLHEGAVRVLANGWVELPTGRLLSPDAVHHIDTQTG